MNLSVLRMLAEDLHQLHVISNELVSFKDQLQTQTSGNVKDNRVYVSASFTHIYNMTKNDIWLIWECLGLH